MRYFPRFFCLKYLFIALFITGCSQPAEEPPNIVLIVVDDLGWTDLGTYGSDLYQTPNVDKLVSSGMRFTDAYAACTVCSPTRASIMTGKYPARINCTDWISGHPKPFAKMKIPEWTKYMATQEVTLAEVLAENGYKTIHIGKWHLGEEEKFWPENQGFTDNIGGWSVGSPQKRQGGNGYFPPYLNPKLADGPEGEYLTERLAQEATDFLERNKENSSPFFMNFWLYNVHTPLQGREAKIAKYQKLIAEGSEHINPVYAAMVEHMDDAVGLVMDKLEQIGKLNNTIVIFTSDNGGLMGNFANGKRRVTSNHPLRSGKGDIYEGGVRVPFVVQWPGRIPEASVSEIPVFSADIYPTVLGLTGIKGDENQNGSMDGVDLSQLLTNQDGIDRDAIFWHYPHYHPEGAKPYSAIRKGDWKLVEVFENNKPELYNLKEDIGETNNLAESNPQKTAELMAELDAWRLDVDAQLPELNPAYNPEFEEEWKEGPWRERSDQEFLEHLEGGK